MIDHPAVEVSPAVPPASPTRRRSRGNLDVRARRRRFVTWALFVGCTVLMVNAVIGENGYLASVRARHDKEALQSDIDRLRLENQRLIDQARRLKTDPAALEEEARRDLGLIRPGETLVIVRDAKPAAPATTPAAPAGQGK